MANPQKVSTCLRFDRQAEEAANFYVSLFPNSRVTAIARHGEGAPMPAGLALTVQFELNGGPHFKLTKPPPSASAATPKPKSTGSGPHSPPTAVTKACAAG